MFEINKNGHVVWCNSGNRVSEAEVRIMDPETHSAYGTLCVKAIEDGAEIERVKCSNY